MSVPRIYLAPEQIADSVKIDDRPAIHKLRDVLRLEQRAPLCVFDGQGKEYLFRIKRAAKDTLIIEKQGLQREGAPSRLKIVLGFPLVREDKADFILQKATELGAWGFSPFICERSLRAKPSPAKLARWHKIIIEAARQSERLWLPQLGPVLSFADLAAASYKVKLLACLSGKDIAPSLNKRCREVLCAVGPEGGFSGREEAELQEAGFSAVRLSPHVLRVETAACFLVGLLNFMI